MRHLHSYKISFLLLAMLLTSACLVSVPNNAFAQECPINLFNPWPDAHINEGFKMRDVHPVTKARTRPHLGVDMNLPSGGDTDCGTPIALNDNCRDLHYQNRGTYGNVLYRDCGNGVTEVYAHLQKRDPGVAYVGKTGHPEYKCHLHYEIRIDDVAVDPLCVWNHDDPNSLHVDDINVSCPDLTGGTSFGGTTSVPNLCDEQVREALKQDAQNKLSGKAGAATPSGGNVADGSGGTGASGSGGGSGGAGGSGSGSGAGGFDYEGQSDSPGSFVPFGTNLLGSGGSGNLIGGDSGDNLATPPPPATASGIGSGITQEMIDTAKNEYVDNADEDPHLDYTLPPEDDCQAPAMTGLVTNRRYGSGRIARIETYDDGFCTQQGCAFVNELFNISGGGEGECKL